MKKVLTLPTVIVLLFAILFAWSCAAPIAPPSGPPIKITCEAVEAEDGSLLFSMWDENDHVFATHSPTPKESLKFEADLLTDVEASKVVQWKWSRTSEVKKFVEIGPSDSKPKIFPGKADPQTPARRVLTIVTLNSAKVADEDRYYIKFIWKGETVTIDPHLRVPKEQ
jgi:hypothetical protein